jgi:putative transposase
MKCPHRQSSATTQRSEVTARGYHRVRCRGGGHGFKEGTGTVFNRTPYPPEVICLVVLWRLRDKLRCRDRAELVLDRGVVFTQEAVREWEPTLTPQLSETRRKYRRGRIGPRWYGDETSRKGKGRGVYLYRVIDREGNLGAVFRSARQDQAAAEAFVRSARAGTDRVPARVTTEGHGADPGASKTERGGGRDPSDHPLLEESSGTGPARN